MTKISYIHGIGQTDPSEYKDRAALVPPRSYINYTALTDGELRLTLLAEQANILAAMYPENKEIQHSRALLIDSLYKGLHNGALPVGIFTGNVAEVVSQIRRARTNTLPSIGKLYGRRNPAKGIGDPLIPYDDCVVIEHEDPLTGWTWQEYEDPNCEKNNQFKSILNAHLEKASHHILYEFVTNANVQPGVVITKSVNHKAATSTIHQTTALGRENIRLWMRNGVLRHNAQKKAGALSPEITIQYLRENGGKSIGIAPAVLVAIIGAIAAAISAAAQMVAACKQADSASAALFNQLQGIGTETWGPEGPDWQIDDGNGGGSGSTTTESNSFFDNDLAMPLLVGAGAYLLLK